MNNKGTIIQFFFLTFFSSDINNLIQIPCFYFVLTMQNIIIRNIVTNQQKCLNKYFCRQYVFVLPFFIKIVVYNRNVP